MKQSDPLFCFCAAASGLGCSASDLADALIPFGRIAAEAISDEEMILLIKQNPALSIFENTNLLKNCGGKTCEAFSEFVQDRWHYSIF